MFAVVIYRYQETTTTTSFACEIPVHGSFSLSKFVDCSALEKRENSPAIQLSSLPLKPRCPDNRGSTVSQHHPCIRKTLQTILGNYTVS